MRKLIAATLLLATPAFAATLKSPIATMEQLPVVLQVLLSRPSMVFIADPWYNEPASDRMRGTQEGASSSLKYNAGGWARGRARAGRGWGGGGREGGNGC